MIFVAVDCENGSLTRYVGVSKAIATHRVCAMKPNVEWDGGAKTIEAFRRWPPADFKLETCPREYDGPTGGAA